MTRESIFLSGLIGNVYDAALDRALWPIVLGMSSEFVGGAGASLFSKDGITQLGDVRYQLANVSYVVGVDPHYQRLYFDNYFRLDPVATGHFLADVEQPVAITDLMPYHDFVETRFYREWVQPQGLVDFVGATLDKSSTSVAMFGVFRHERNGVVDDEARHRMRLIAPHIRRATLIGRMFDLGAAETATFADTLDGLGAGIYLVEAGGRIVHANASGHAILDAGDILRAAGGRLVACDAQVDQTLRDVFAAAGQGDAELGTKGIAVPLSSSPEERWLAHLLPLTSGMRRKSGIAYSAVAAMFVRKASLEIPSSIEVLSRLYGLTPGELRVLGALNESDSLPALAELLGISVGTVKTHLQNLFAKTGTNRQAGLVKLVAAHASPLSR